MKSIIKCFSEHGTLIQPECLDYIMSKDKPDDFASLIIDSLKEYPLVLSLEDIKSIEKKEDASSDDDSTDKSVLARKNVQGKVLKEVYGGVLKKHIENDSDEDIDDDLDEDYLCESDESGIISESDFKIEKVKGWKPKAAEYDSEIKILKDVTGNSNCEGTTDDFAKLFVDRFDVLRKILRSQRREMANVVPINRLNKNGVKEIQIVGIVKEVRNTTNGHRLIELEDDTGVAVCIALKHEREAILLSKEVVLDEIVGIKAQLSKNGDLLIVKNVVFPDVSIQKNHNRAQVPVYAAFLSDIHIGSKKFMEPQWRSFIRWINGGLGNSRQKDAAGRIKYIVIPGDVVDGIGIYPNQEKELSITDVYRQYEALAEHLSMVPDHISIIMQPGNHDAVRPAEPQPTFEQEIQDLFSGKDIHFVGNPCYFSLHGVEVLSYHGQSLLDFATNIQHLEYNKPVDIMKVMLKKHHLAPTYGGFTPLAPEHSDYMVIDRVPDIFVTGHVHLATIGDYRGVTLINASSWQEQTGYQKMMNFVPDSAKLPIVDLKKGNVTMMDFNKK